MMHYAPPRGGGERVYSRGGGRSLKQTEELASTKKQVIAGIVYDNMYTGLELYRPAPPCKRCNKRYTGRVSVRQR